MLIIATSSKHISFYELIGFQKVGHNAGKAVKTGRL